METYKRYIYYLGSTITPFNINQLLGCVAPDGAWWRRPESFFQIGVDQMVRPA
jgi:hypothetical protein